jgi:hypothetical protein
LRTCYADDLQRNIGRQGCAGDGAAGRQRQLTLPRRPPAIRLATMDSTLPRRLRDHCPRCKGSLDCMVFIGVSSTGRLVMVCESCYAELQDPKEPACFRPATLEGLAAEEVSHTVISERRCHADPDRDTAEEGGAFATRREADNGAPRP